MKIDEIVFNTWLLNDRYIGPLNRYHDIECYSLSLKDGRWFIGNECVGTYEFQEHLPIKHFGYRFNFD